MCNRRVGRWVFARVLAWVLGLTIVVALAGPVTAIAGSIGPNPLLTIDQNRTTVVDRVVAQWGDGLAAAGAGLGKDQLQALLTGLRSDQLLAASLAGSLEGLRNVIANALTANVPLAKGLIQTKALGDAGDDLEYTPVVPCRLADSRPSQGGPGPLPAFATRDYKVFGPAGTFTPQGGDPGTCNIPANPAAVVLNITAVTPAGTGNLIAFPTGAAVPNASVLNYTAATFALANGAIVPACATSCVNQISIKANGPTVDVVIDIVGYFKAPGDVTGLNILVNGQRALRLEYNVNSPNVIGGHPNNNVTAGIYGATIAGGGFTSNSCYDAPTQSFTRSCANQVSAQHATVGGGYGNIASGTWGTVGGGAGNTAGGSYSFTAGLANTIGVGGAGSVALGQGAVAPHEGCLVFGDYSTSNPVGCYGAANQVILRGLGGFYFFTAGSDNATYTGATLASGSGAWAVWSDRNGKENVVPVAPRDVLAKVVDLPLATWNWKSQDRAVRHMGPMAQDFHAAFGLGESERSITTVDADGVALAAIQGLNAKVEEQIVAKDAEIRTLTRELVELRRSVEELMARTSSEGRMAQAN